VITIRLQEPLLTQRQREIVTLIAEDFSYKEIGAKLRITEKAVYHIQRIKRKIKAKDSAGIVRYAIREGLIKP